jgi:hypothetical protein
MFEQAHRSRKARKLNGDDVCGKAPKSFELVAPLLAK